MSPTTESDLFDVELGTDCNEVDSPHNSRASDQKAGSLERSQTPANAKRIARKVPIISALVLFLCCWYVGTHFSNSRTSDIVNADSTMDDRRSLFSLQNGVNAITNAAASVVETKAQLFLPLQELMKPFEDGSRSDLISLSKLDLKNILKYYYEYVPQGLDQMSKAELEAQVQTFLDAQLLLPLQELMKPFEDGSRSYLISLSKLDLKNILKYYYEYVPQGLDQMSKEELVAQVQTLLDAAKQLR